MQETVNTLIGSKNRAPMRPNRWLLKGGWIACSTMCSTCQHMCTVQPLLENAADRLAS